MSKNRESIEFSSSEPVQAPDRPRTREGLSGRKVAVMVADGFEQSEFDGPVEALREAGITVEVLAPDSQHLERIKGVNHFEPGPGTSADKVIGDARAEDYDALVIPGGLASPDTMRQSRPHLDLVKAFFKAGKPVASICHGPWLLADADVLQGRKVTSWPGIRRDVERAGATWTDEQVVVDDNLVTSRKPDDVPAFADALLDLIGSRVSRSS
jgi:protease I